jgi:hypothetical protein
MVKSDAELPNENGVPIKNPVTANVTMDSTLIQWHQRTGNSHM